MLCCLKWIKSSYVDLRGNVGDVNNTAYEPADRNDYGHALYTELRSGVTALKSLKVSCIVNNGAVNSRAGIFDVFGQPSVTANPEILDARYNWWGAATIPAEAANSSVDTSLHEGTPPVNCTVPPQPTATPIPISTLPPFVTNTPRPGTPTPTAIPTLSPEQLADIFPVPIDNPNPIRLTSASNYDFEDRVDNQPPLCSRDIHPVGGITPSTLIVPDDAEVMIVDTVFNDEENIGNFVAVRTRIADLPPEIKDILETNVSSPVSALIAQDIGYLYFGYAHLTTVTAPLPNFNEYTSIPKQTTIGTTGNTGLDPNNPEQGVHLDLSVFYVSGNYPGGDPNTLNPEPHRLGNSNPSDNFFGIFEAPEIEFEVNFGKMEVIDPVTLWPILIEGISAPIDFTCP